MRYEFRVSGVVSEALVEAFPEFDRVALSDETLFRGPVIDEAHLYGILARLQSLGLHVLEMRQLPESRAGPRAGAGSSGNVGEGGTPRAGEARDPET